MDTIRFIGPPRYRVRVRPDDDAPFSVVTLGYKPPDVRVLRVIGKCASFSDQRDGTLYLVSWAVVESVDIEQCDQYETWHKTGEWTPTEE